MSPVRLRLGLGLGNIGPSEGSLGIPSLYLGQVATRGRIPSAFSASNKVATGRSFHVMREDVLLPQFEFPNWYWARGTTGPETNPGGNITYTASVEYPTGVFTQILFSGSASKLVASGGVTLSDPVSLAIPAGAPFWVRTFATAVAGIVFLDSPVGFPQRDLANGEAYEYAASGVTDKTMGGTINDVGATSAPIFGPTAIVAQTRKPSALILGDSRDWGFNDTLDSSGDLGDIARSLGPSMGYINAACSGDAISALIAGGTKRIALQQYVSHVVIGDTINSLRASPGQAKTAAAVLAELQALLALFPTKRKFVSTTGGPGKVTSGNGFIDLAGQTVDGNSAAVAAFNDAIRAGVANVEGYFELADRIESSRNSGKWWVNGVANANTADGLHSTQAGYLRIPAGTAIDTARFTRAGL